MDDLFQIGCVGLIKAIDNFDITQDVQFSTYGVPMIIGEIRRYLRDNNSIRVSRSVKDLAYKVIQLKEKFNNQVLNKDNKTYSLNKIAGILEIETTYVERFKKSYETSLDTLSGYWQKILIGAGVGAIALPVIVLFFINPIAGAIAGKGLAGIAAFNAGMAALGGGAIAAGGFGVAGGIAVLVGGSLILGGSTGAVIGMAANNPKVMMTEMAKMQVVMKEIVLGLQKDTVLFQEILNKLTSNELEMRQEIKRLQEDNEANKEKIKNLQEALEYLEKGINELKK